MTTHPYRDATRPVDERVDDLLSRMTLAEKAGQLTQFFYLGISEVPADLDLDSLPVEHRAYVQQPAMVTAGVSAGTVGSVLFVKDVALANSLQRRGAELVGDEPREA